MTWVTGYHLSHSSRSRRFHSTRTASRWTCPWAAAPSTVIPKPNLSQHQHGQHGPLTGAGTPLYPSLLFDATCPHVWRSRPQITDLCFPGTVPTRPRTFLSTYGPAGSCSRPSGNQSQWRRLTRRGLEPRASESPVRSWRVGVAQVRSERLRRFSHRPCTSGLTAELGGVAMWPLRMAVSRGQAHTEP